MQNMVVEITSIKTFPDLRFHLRGSSLKESGGFCLKTLADFLKAAVAQQIDKIAKILARNKLLSKEK